MFLHAQNVANLAKQSTVFGGFYRDLRSLNLALAESKLEAGMVYNDMIRENFKAQNLIEEDIILFEESIIEKLIFYNITSR